MSSIPDLVRDNKLETDFAGKFTIHYYDDSDGEEHRPSNQRSEHWEDGRLLGRGGLSDVLLQRCVEGKHIHELRAVKKIARSISQAKQSDYMRELETIAKFSHRRYSKCFVKLLGWYNTDDYLCIAMEYFPLGDLQQYMSKTGPMAEADVCVIIYQVLEGLNYMHREGFAHRDIKPGNVLIKSQPPQPNWWVKLSDFGISKRIEGSTEKLSTVKGTQQYMAPELVSHEPGSTIQVDHQVADMWSLGVMAHCMLTATAAFSNILALLRYVNQPDLFQFQELAKHGASGDVESFIRALMKPKPEHRLTSDKALEHTWIQPYRPSRVNLAPSRTSKPASNINTPSLRATRSPNSWATGSSMVSVPPLGQDRNLGGIFSTATGQSEGTNPAPDRDDVHHPMDTAPPLQVVVQLDEDIGGAKDPPLLASGSYDKTVKIWDPATGQCVSTLKGHTQIVSSVAWSHDATRLASGSYDVTVKIWDPATGQCVSTLKGHTQMVCSVAWSHDATRLASGSYDVTVKIWDPATGQCVSTLKGHTQMVSSVAWSHDATRLASGSHDETVKIWDPATGQCVSTLKGHTLMVSSVAWSHDATRLASGSHDLTVKIWDPATGQCVSTLKGHTDSVSSVAWSQDATRLASGSIDKTVKIWDPATGQCVSTLKGHTYFVSSVAWSQDATWLASGSADKTVKIWDPATGQCVSTLKGHTDLVSSVAWSHP